MAVLDVDAITKSLGGAEIIGGLSLRAEQGEFISVVGPSGCGKTTLLTCLAGLRRPDSGAVAFEGRRLDGPPDGMALIFQDYSRSLLPWRRNIDNVTFGMRRIAATTVEKRDRAMEILAAVGLRGFDRHYPWQVSGGMQQRVAIARALAAKPRLLLLDEPLAAVDAQTRADIQDLLLKLAAELGKTCLLVTHDVDEALYMADRVIVLSNRPTHVVDDIRVALPRPRDQIATRAAPAYLQLRERVLNLIRAMRTTA
ncbi:MAG: ABC transporter ATP-binding protein [Hyphomicrobiales bacterium]|nr:ABC transporter ATP-binding protein [Hyphomicrobiales bacterium]